MTTAEERIMLDEPVELLVLPVADDDDEPTATAALLLRDAAASLALDALDEVAAEFGFDPNQRRGDDGKWTKGVGVGGPTVRAQRATRRGLRPTASDSVKLPPQPPVKVADRASAFVDGWMTATDPAERAMGFWQGRFSDQRAIRQVFRNIAAGKDDPTDGLNLDTAKNWDHTYLRVEEPRPPGVPYEEWEALEKADGVPRVYDRDDLRNELTSAGRWLHEALADAPVSTQPLYRGMRMKRSELPKVGETFEADAISWAEERYWAEHYAYQPEDEKLGRVGDTEVVFRLNGPKRSVDLGPNFLDEHITQGRYRVVRVSGKGGKRFVTVEEVPADE